MKMIEDSVKTIDWSMKIEISVRTSGAVETIEGSGKTVVSFVKTIEGYVGKIESYAATIEGSMKQSYAPWKLSLGSLKRLSGPWELSRGLWTIEDPGKRWGLSENDWSFHGNYQAVSENNSGVRESDPQKDQGVRDKVWESRQND